MMAGTGRVALLCHGKQVEETSAFFLACTGSFLGFLQYLTSLGLSRTREQAGAVPAGAGASRESKLTRAAVWRRTADVICRRCHKSRSSGSCGNVAPQKAGHAMELRYTTWLASRR